VRLLEGPSPAELVDLLEAGMAAAALLIPADEATGAPERGIKAGGMSEREARRTLEGLDGLSDEEVDRILKEMLDQRETTS
jgi:hypothetical protein